MYFSKEILKEKMKVFIFYEFKLSYKNKQIVIESLYIFINILTTN